MVLAKRLTHLLLLAAITTDMAAATFVRHDAQRQLQAGETEFVVTAPSGEEYMIEFSDENGTSVEQVVIVGTGQTPATTVTVVGGSIKTIEIGSDTYSVSYDSSGEVDEVTLVSTPVSERRRNQELVGEGFDFFERRLVSCENSCEASANTLCGALTFACADPTGALYALLGSLCDNIDDLCDVTGIVAGCARSCAPACVDDDDCTEPNEICCPAFLVCEVPDITGACGDPHMTGFLGQKFDFTGEDGECVKLDGQESLISPGEVILGPGVAVSAVNLPGACRSFGFEKYWEHKKLQNAGGGRKLGLIGFMQNMGEWILADPTATNMNECAQYVAAAGETGLFEHESEHASFQILTPTGTIRLSHGRLHQLAMRDPTDQFDLPDHTSWQMNVAIDHHDVSLEATGVLGETVVPTLDANGKFIMKGMDAIRGMQGDYRVAGPFDTVFAQVYQ
eukprot:g5334.t1